MTNAISLEETCDYEPMPKAATLSISGSDAKALDDFVRHVSIRCYDERFNGGGKKSRELSLQLERMREILDTLLDYPEIEQSYYWVDAQGMQADETIPDLLAAVADRSGIHFHQVGVYLAPDSIASGTLQLAVDDEAGETCGIVKMPMWPTALVSAPTWTKSGGTLDDTIDVFSASIPLNFEGRQDRSRDYTP